MRKSIRLMAITSLLAITLCSCSDKSVTSGESVTSPTKNSEKTPQVSQIHFTEESTTEPEVLIEVNPFEGWDFNEEFVRDEDGRISDNFCSNYWYSEVDEFLKEHGISARMDLYTLDGKLISQSDISENETLVAKLGIPPYSVPKDECELYTDRVETSPGAEGWERLTEEDFLDYCKKRGIIFTEISREVVVKVTKDETTEAE